MTARVEIVKRLGNPGYKESSDAKLLITNRQDEQTERTVKRRFGILYYPRYPGNSRPFAIYRRAGRFTDIVFASACATHSRKEAAREPAGTIVRVTDTIHFYPLRSCVF